MKRRVLWRAATALIVLSIAVPLVQASPMPSLPEEGPPPPLPQAHEPEVTGPGGRGAQPDPLSKLDSELRELAEEGGEEAVTVYVRAKAGADLSGVANVTETRPFVDDELVVAEVEPAMLAKLASNPDVLAAEKFKPIPPPKPLLPSGEESQRPTEEEIAELWEEVAECKAAGPEGAPEVEIPAGVAAPDRPESPEDWNGSDLIGAPEAWANGYTGEGVNIAILDSGVDFGHPDLEDNVAFYDGGAYDGWPIALDPRSMRQYYYHGSTSWNNYWDETDYSWYADVDDVLHCTDGMTTSFDFDGHTYTIDDEIVQMSQSGEIRWGVHPDIQFPGYVSGFGNWMPFILVDSTTAGVYDTVIADLNLDFWFDATDDTAVLGTSDPVLNQDFGSYVYTDTVVMTGTQYVPNWFTLGWGYPPTWYDGWDTTPTTDTLPAGTFILAENHYTAEGATTGEDGIADISGGMAYFIADGERPIPGMDYLYPDGGPGGMPPIPFNGQLVAFMLGSDWAGGGDHGTLCASAATASGNITGYFAAYGEKVQYDPEDWSSFFNADDVSEYLPWLKDADEGTVQGPAPGADIIAIGDNYAVVNGMQGFYDAYTFLAYGVDGEPNSGDEFVDIASMSYGDGSVHNDGWDWESRLISYYNQTYLPNTTFLASSGNGGHGFGTINSPQGNTTVSVGASTQYGASDVFGSALSADQINDGEVQPFSGRGPDALGRPDPDVVATGAWGAGNTPLNKAGFYNWYFGGWFAGDGNNAWYEWGGTSRSAPEAAGVTALIYQAYEDAMGSAPDFETAREILMSGADDLNHDVLMQGAGRVNADRATDVAGGDAGVYVSPSLLAAGEYQGTHYESFGNVLYPGDTWDQTFTVHNPSAADASVTVGDEMLMEMDVMTYTQVVSPFLGTEGPYPETYYYHADYFVGGDVTTTTHGSDLAIPVPADADLMQVQLVTPFELFDFDYDDPDPTSLSYSANERWSLTVYDWQDRNGDGKLWEDTNADGVVSASAGDLVDVSWTGAVTQTEINRFAYGYNYAAEQEVTVRLGDRTDYDNILLGIVHNNPNNTRPGWGPDEYQEHPLQIKVVFYEKMDWDLVTESPTSLTVPAGGEATFDASFTVPSDQAPGLYEGAITVDDGTHLSIVPTTVNVAVPSDELLFDLGGTEKAGTPYDNGRMFGGWTWSSPLEQGDWRFYYYDADAGFEQQYLYVRNQWGELCDNMPTANETLVWGPNPGDQFSMAEPDKFGPYGMQFAGGTWDAFGPQTGWYNPRRGDWWRNADDTPQPESRAWATLWDGLNQVQFRNILNSGDIVCGEEFEATTGVFGVDAPAWEQGGLQVDTDELSGSFELDAVSPVDGLIAYAGGFEEKQTFKNQDVPQGKHAGEFPPSDLMDGWVHTFEVTNTWGIEARTFGPGSSDIDLYLLYDANDDGIFNPYDNREWLGVYDTSGDSNEYVSYSGNFSNGGQVQDGTYAVVMYGYQVEPGDQFDLHLMTYGGDDLNIEGANADNNYVLDVTPGAAEALTVNWEVPSTGVWHGMLWFGMPWEEGGQYYSMGPGFYVPVVVNAGGIDASVTKTVDKDWVLMGREVLTYTIEVMNDGNESAWVEVVDLLPEGVDYHVQYVSDPDHPDYDTSYVAKWWFENNDHGYFWPDGDDYLRWDGDVGPGVSGKLTIQYQVKVEDGFAGEIVNKADVTFDYGDYHKFMSSTATTQVARPVFLPIVTRNW